MTNKQRFILFLKEKNIYPQFIRFCILVSKNTEKKFYESVKFCFDDIANPFLYLKVYYPYTFENIEREWETIWREKMGSVFCAFLKENNVYETFQSQIHKNFLYYLTSSFPAIYILAAFDWSRTPEGYDFWKRISLKWREIEKIQHYPNTEF